MQRAKRRFWVSLAVFFVLEAAIIYAALFCWGFIGRVEAKRLKNIIHYSTQAEKEVLCNALNFYYNKGFSKYTSGLLLRCDHETESMMNQFMWFHRNVASYYIFDDASYHEIVVSALDYFDLIDNIETENVSTWYLERRLVNWQKEQEESSLTNKDKNSLLLTLIDTGGGILLGSSNPVGWSISALNLLHKSGSDPAKAIPAIVVFKKQRERKFLWSLLILTAFNGLGVWFIRRKKKK